MNTQDFDFENFRGFLGLYLFWATKGKQKALKLKIRQEERVDKIKGDKE